ncbi:NHLP bacteriocin system secretion protein [Gemmatimonas groenlandica]|uniref:NHLP bacteriocin system secretion protein n=1 Tax=Gemmatimonas groenlandica TaxID=2732249 RepID=A0A6M4IJU9_9BACT|nr:NHLP bacteriocin system secretion protein [Gemmatimonas groenlandica]QJR35354.1 NHLP bacteriocin system secretion protein [Gemmatimonas groenlandica]
MAPASPFRQSALDRLASPEQLDRMLVVTSPRLWSVLVGLLLLVGALLTWSLLGRIPITVDGTGILLSTEGLREVEVLGSGVVESLPVRAGDLVNAGALIARIRQPRLEQAVAQAGARVQALRQELGTRDTFIKSNAALETRRLDGERSDMTRRLESLTERAAFLEQRVQAEREARALGLLTETAVQASVAALEAGRGELAALQLDMQNNTLRRLQLANSGVESVTDVRRRLEEAERDLSAQQLELTQAGRVTSPYRGYIRELRTSIGQLVTVGQALVSIELADVPLQALVFVSNDGKRIAPGMEARVAPATVKREEFGFIVGRVQTVSAQPMTLAGMTRTLGNDLLVQQLAARGASFLVEVTLQRDTSTASGFRWSTRDGPPAQVGSGTSIGVSVVVARRRPITLLLPFLRSTLGLSA